MIWDDVTSSCERLASLLMEEMVKTLFQKFAVPNYVAFECNDESKVGLKWKYQSCNGQEM